jgi:predicted nucleic acid-binding protein
MKAVLDASVSLRVALTSPLTPKAVKFLDDYRKQVHELIAPSIYPGEIANGLTKAERQKLIQQGQAPGLVAGLLSYPPILHDYEPLVIRATAMSSQFRAGFYDCL